MRAALLISVLWIGCTPAAPSAAVPGPQAEPTPAGQMASGPSPDGVSSSVATSGVSSGTAAGGISSGSAAGGASSGASAGGAVVGEVSSEALFVSRRRQDRVALALPAIDPSMPYVVANQLGHFTEEDIRIELQAVDAEAAVRGVLDGTYTFVALATDTALGRLPAAALRVVFHSEVPPSVVVTAAATLSEQPGLVRRFLRGSIKGFWIHRAVADPQEFEDLVRGELRPTSPTAPRELFSYDLAQQGLQELIAEDWRPR